MKARSSHLVVIISFMALHWIPVQGETVSSAEDALKLIQSAATVDSSAVGVGGDQTETYDAFLILRNNATKQQLIDLTENPSANIRAYAAMALKEKFPEADFGPLLTAKLKDESTFVSFSGCSKETLSVGDFYFETFGESLSPSQRPGVIDYLLEGGIHLSAASHVLEEWDIPESHLPRVRQLVNEDNEAAIIALAKFKREEDAPTIIAAAKNHPFQAFRAIALDPRPAYFSLLEKLQPALLAEDSYSTITREFYRALAAFKTPEAISMLAAPVDGNQNSIPAREDHRQFIAEIISPDPDPVYDELKWRLWAECQLIDLVTFHRLTDLDEKRATGLIRVSLDHLSYKIQGELLSAMFSRINQSDPAYAKRLVTKELGKMDLSHFAFFAEVAGRIKDEADIEPLFHAVESATNPHIFLPAATALIAYHQPAIGRRLIATPEKNTGLVENWSADEFRKLLDIAAAQLRK
jgi:hypothetical protein